MGEVVANRFEIEALVGSGGMGEVFRARDRSLGEIVALKRLTVEAGREDEAIQRFRQEVRLARRVTHKNVARVYDLVETSDGALLLSMEFIDGISLRQLLRQRATLSIREAARIGIEVCAGLAAVHDVGIVHRDLKPDNILLDRDGRVVLTDFGVARSWMEAMSVGAGSVVGTPRYMAPEQRVGLLVGPRADLYALGVTLAEMVIGREAADDDARRAALSSADPGGSFAGVAIRCLEAEPGARPASAADVERALAAVVLAAPVTPNALRSPTRASYATTMTRPTAGEPAMVHATTVDATIPVPIARVRDADNPAAPTRTVAVAALRIIGSDGLPGLGETMSESIVDTLSRTHELRVLASGTADGSARDRLRHAKELGAALLVEGTIHVGTDRVRVTVRLIDARDGSQIWSESFEGHPSEVTDVDQPLARRVAEAVRWRAVVHGYADGAPPDATRWLLETRGKGPAMDVIERLERTLAVAPMFAPALTSYAMACLDAWYIPVTPTGADWRDRCASAVARALSSAPLLPETHAAAAMLALSEGRTGDALVELRRALELAPTCVDALELLGELECKVGRSIRGTKRLRLAAALDPERPGPRVVLAREAALSGNAGEAEGHLGKLGDAVLVPPAFLMRMRIAAWLGDEATLRSLLARSRGVTDAARRVFYVEVIGRALLGEATRDEIEAHLRSLLEIPKDPRFYANVLVHAVEIALRGDRRDDALAHLRRLAAMELFVDSAWLERCPLLAPIRGTPEHDDALRSAAVHAQALTW
jgi:eukaryotic-like serine/threonine-protein kinase